MIGITSHQAARLLVEQIGAEVGTWPALLFGPLVESSPPIFQNFRQRLKYWRTVSFSPALTSSLARLMLGPKESSCGEPVVLPAFRDIRRLFLYRLFECERRRIVGVVDSIGHSSSLVCLLPQPSAARRRIGRLSFFARVECGFRKFVEL